ISPSSPARLPRMPPRVRRTTTPRSTARRAGQSRARARGRPRGRGNARRRRRRATSRNGSRGTPGDAAARPHVMTPPRPRSRRPGFWVGLVGLAVAALLGVTSGLAGAVAFAALYVAVCALWALVTRRAWWGPTSRPVAGVVAGAALVLVVGAALADGAVRGEDGVEVGSHRPAPSATDTIPEPVAPEPVIPSAAPSSADPTPTPKETPEAQPGTALAAVARLEVKGRAPRTGYEREHFGQRWADVDRNGCDQRNDVLRRDLTDVVVDDGTGGCVVRSGTLAEPYSGRVVAFERGDDTSALVQIDHVVALADAWQKG